MKKYLLTGAVAALVVATLLGASGWVRTHVRALAFKTRTDVEKGMPDDVVEAVIKTKLSDFDRQIESYHVTVGRLADKAAASETDLADAEKKLDDETALLRKCKAMLDRTDRTEYVINGRTYDRDQIAADAQARLGKCKQLESQLDAKKKLHASLRQAVKEGKDNLTRAKKMRLELAGELDNLKAKLATARAREEIGQITAAVKDMPAGLDSDLARALAELKDRAATADHKADFLANDARGGDVVDWSRTEPDDVSREIAKYLKGGAGGPSTGTPTAPARAGR